MAINLVCTTPLHGVKKGDVVSDPAEIARYLASHPHHFNKVSAPDPKPEIEPTKPDA